MRWSPLGRCLAVVIVVVAGCSQPVTTGAAPPPIPAALTPGQDALLLYAEDVLISRCMARSGLEFTAVRPSDAALRQTTSDLYGTDDVAWAQAHGYGFADGAAASQADPNETRMRDATPAVQARYQEALYGRPDQLDQVTLADGRRLTIAVSGCVADARRQLYGDVLTYVVADFVAVNLEGHIVQSVLADARYTQALTDWRTCMAARGLTVSGPDAARKAGAERGRAAEATIAVADAECARASALVTTAMTVDHQLWAHVDADTLRQVARDRSLRDAALPAARVLAGRASS